MSIDRHREICQVAAAIERHLERVPSAALRLAESATPDERESILLYARDAVPILGIAPVVYGIARRIDGEQAARAAASADNLRLQQVLPDPRSADWGRPERKGKPQHRLAIDERPGLADEGE